MKVRETQSFKGMPLYDMTAKVQENTLLNRGLIDIGGCGIPYAIMSNNKDERIERITETSLYFAMSFLTPFIMLPLFNRRFLASNKLVKNFKNNEKRILEVSKEYLSKDADYMVKGIRDTAKKLTTDANKSAKTSEKEKAKTIVSDFENILSRFKDKEELRITLLKTHEGVFRSDFLATCLMWCATPWLFTGLTELRTHRKGFSATYGMMEQKQIDEKEYNKQKHKKMLATVLISVIPALIVPKLVVKAIRDDHTKLLGSKNIIKKASGKFLNSIKKNASNFDYTKAMFMSKTIFASMWLLSSYPVGLVSSRDKYELKDRAIRKGSLLAMYFGGDFLINNITGRISDKYFGTKIMDTEKLKKNAGFIERFKLVPRNFYELPDMKNIDAKTLKKTKTTGAALYWVSLLANMALIGFAVPAFLNKLLKNSIQKDLKQTPAAKKTAQVILPDAFDKFKF